MQNVATEKFLLQNDILNGNKLVLVLMDKCIIEAASQEKGDHLKVYVIQKKICTLYGKSRY